jgi:hypothetical protein
MTVTTRSWIAAALAAGALALACGPALSEGQVERIVFLRHGEKPALGLGQLDCRGLNRALALPRVIADVFGRPDAIIAPDPSEKKRDAGESYDYVRPLATIEPTAVAFGLPVEAHIGFTDVDALQAALEAPTRHKALVVVAWEHKIIDVVARNLLNAHGGDSSKVVKWEDGDFDSLDVVTIDWSGPHATFERAAEGLDGVGDDCPG